jgi:monofunctional biosynthetic peptidoglycan transglycosylase
MKERLRIALDRLGFNRKMRRVRESLLSYGPMIRRWILTVSGVCVALVLWVGLVPMGPVPRPGRLKTANPVTSALIEIRRAQAKAKQKRFVPVQRWVPLSRVSRELQRSVLAAEDSGFYHHHGVEWELVRKAMEDNWRAGRPVRGASTITQQLAKNLYLSPRKSYVRKLRELLYTWRLEAALPKRRILEIYLNVVEWGDGIFGVEAAAQVYFGKPARDLTWDESVALAAALPSPRRHHPGDGSRWMANREAWVWTRLAESGLKDD